jgi:hypothetical protein
MKMNFSKDELAMVYQYAAGTKEETLAGLKEIVPVRRSCPADLRTVPGGFSEEAAGIGQDQRCHPHPEEN